MKDLYERERGVVGWRLGVAGGLGGCLLVPRLLKTSCSWWVLVRSHGHHWKQPGSELSLVFNDFFYLRTAQKQHRLPLKESLHSITNSLNARAHARRCSQSCKQRHSMMDDRRPRRNIRALLPQP
eukprot:355487-Chlamydomonas_euryale.AAC.4